MVNLAFVVLRSDRTRDVATTTVSLGFLYTHELPVHVPLRVDRRTTWNVRSGSLPTELCERDSLFA